MASAWASATASTSVRHSWREPLCHSLELPGLFIAGPSTMVSIATDIPRQEPQKSYHTILEQHVRQAQEELERPAGALLLSGLSAGLDLGFGPFLMAVIA